MATADKPDTLDLMMLLAQAKHALETELAAALATIGSTPRAQCVLAKAMEGERTQSQLAEMATIDKTTMVVTMDALEREGLAERRPSAADRRARVVRVTPKGERLVDEGKAIIDGIVDDVLGALPAADRATFLACLQRLVGEGGRLATPAHTVRPVRRRAVRARAQVAG
jgi:MarR family transcriptional regulator, transcriptional regulator for hemolysin